MVDRLKIEVVVQLPPPTTIFHLQSLQGKEIFLCRFISKYPEITKWIMRLFKKGAPFDSIEQSQRSFESLKNALTKTSLLSPLDYSIDLILYLVYSNATIDMVIV